MKEILILEQKIEVLLHKIVDCIQRNGRANREETEILHHEIYRTLGRDIVVVKKKK